MASIQESYPVAAGDFTSAGEVSGAIKRMLKRLGVDSALVRRISIAAYEVELNLVIHSQGGRIELRVEPECVVLHAIDIGPGIPDISLAMSEGFSTASDDVRTMGFGAGMGLPNMARNASDFQIESQMGVGTKIRMRFALPQG